MTAASRESEDDFWQKLILPEEDRRSLFPGMASVVSGVDGSGRPMWSTCCATGGAALPITAKGNRPSRGQWRR